MPFAFPKQIVVLCKIPVLSVCFMLAFPNAKINLGLYITEKRPDGFHNLESCFYPIGCTDVLEVIESETVQFTSSGIDIPGEGSSNLCMKAYRTLKDVFDLPPVHIHLHKVIPIGAGLGGGSADAAFTLKILNEKFDLKLSESQLEDYLRPLGSDCAFFVKNQPRYCYGKGDLFEDIHMMLSGYFLVLVYPGIHISTVEAYAGIRPKRPTVSLKDTLSQPIQAWKESLHNDFEDSLFVKYPTLPAIKEKLYEQGAVYASMSGSGSTIYGLFEKEIPLEGLFPAFYTCWQTKL